MKTIPLTQGKVAIVDDEDYEALVAGRKWGAVWCKPKWYAARKTGGRNNQRTVYMHRFILEAGPSIEVDHRNGDGLDNRRENIRLATRAQNAANRSKASHNTSGFKGVLRGRNGHGWQAVIVVNKRAKYLGQYATPEEAAAVYDRAAVALLGEFAQTNERTIHNAV